MNAFKPIEIEDKKVFDRFFESDPPEISEHTFTNLFIWRHRYRPVWLAKSDCLLILFRPNHEEPYGLPPAGPGDKGKALKFLCEEVGKTSPKARIRRVGEVFVKEFVDPERYETIPDRDNSDYVYRTRDLIRLSGNKYHRKKNHLNQFMKNHVFEYRELTADLVKGFLEMQEGWCQLRECSERPELLAEDYAIREALLRFKDLRFRGGAILINSRVEAFALGEPLSADTAVIHVEKANPDIPGLYAAINQLFCLNAWSALTYVNREQDMGSPGLRKAKESYYPHHMINKYTIIPK